MQNIKNIIFDLGGVFIEIDYPKTEQAFINLGVDNFRELYNQHNASQLFEKLETGQFTAEQFYGDFRKTAHVKATNQQLENAWNAMLGNFYPRHIEWLSSVKNQFNIYLYSNTNIIHYYAFQKIYRDQFGETNFDEHFIRAYYSHDLGLRKPYPEGFEAILQKEDLQANETLFIDDTLKNIEGASGVGLHTIHLVNAFELIPAVEEYCGILK